MTTKIDRNYLLKRKHISLKAIFLNEDNYRQKKDQKNIFASIKAHGLEDPLTVRPIDDTVKSEIKAYEEGYKFVVVDGDCRLEALKKIMQDDDQLEVGPQIIITDIRKKEAKRLQLRLNGPRNDYTDYEWLLAIRDILEEEPKISVRKLGIEIGKSKSFAEQRMKFIREATVNDWTAVQTEFITVRKWYDSKVSTRGHLEEDSDESSLAGKLVHGGVVRETIAIEGPEEIPITKSPKFLCHTQFFDKLQETFPDVKFLDIKMVGAFTGFNVESEDAETKTKIIDLMHSLDQEAKQEAKFEKSKASEEHRTTRFTENQFRAIEIVSEFEDEIHSYQIIGNERTIIWKSFKSKMDALKWLLDHKADFPLTRWQLEKYTDLPQEEIQKLVEDSIQQVAEERVKEKPKGPVKEAWAFISEQEYDSLLPSIKALITFEEPAEDERIQVYFSSWEDESTMSRWLKPSREHLEAILQFPVSTFLSTNLKDILINEKELKKHFPNVYQELKQLQNFCKNIKSISLRSMEEITKAAKRLEVFMREVDLDLQHLKRTRRITGSEEQHLKICQKCLQPKWMISKRDLCGNCEVSNNKQNKKAAAISSSGGQK